MARLKYILLVMVVALVACHEDIDVSNRYTFTQETIVSYLQKHEQYSEYLDVLGHATASRISETTLRQLLSARGHYTVFVPTNDAIHAYLESLVGEGLIDSASWDAFESDHVRDSIYDAIAKNSVIDGGDERVFETTDFPTVNNGEFSLANMNDRKLTVRYSETGDTIFINQNCRVNGRNCNIPALNGVMHVMDDVIAPSDITFGHLIDNILNSETPGFIVAAKMLAATGLKDSLNKVRDEVYEEKYLRGDIPDMDGKMLGWTFHGATGHGTAYAPQHRRYGFTVFAETDDFWREALHKEPHDITPEDVMKWILDNEQYSQGDHFTTGSDYTSCDNLLNQWMSYHMLPMRIPTNKLVFHVNEKGYNFKTSTKYTIPVMEFYTTMGARRLIKIYESAQSNGIYLNRFPVLDNRRNGTYRELRCDADKVGCRINTDGDEVQKYMTVNGVLYGIDAPLSYTDEVRENLSRGRIRFDGMSLFPEAMNNDIRKKASNDYRNQYVHIPPNSVYHYFENMDLTDNSHFVYLNSYGYDWCNLDQDEMKACGQYEITVKLPPVPRKDTYELRYRVLPTPERGVIQFYFGTDKTRLVPTGIPIDLRVNGNDAKKTGWEADTHDDTYDAEVDKKMRNNNRMKGEEAVANGSGTARSAGNGHIYRYILVRQQMDPDKTYYLRMKSVLESETTEFYMDYLEFCAKEIFDNPAEPEDIW